MKIRVLSDLHLEYGLFEFPYKHYGEDVVVLAGDIMNRGRHAEFIKQIPNHVEIVMVSGNHEYYRGSFTAVNDQLKALEDKYPNFHFLLDEGIKIGDVDFFGGTMYTDLQLFGYDPVLEMEVRYGINDFEWIQKMDRGSFRRWTVEDHKSCHEKFCYELAGWLKRTEGAKRVVVSHFVPTSKAIAPQYQMSRLNPYFTSDMERFMGWEGYWFAGHTHSSFRGQVGDTKIVINPKGYGHRYENRQFEENLIVEI